MKSLAELEAIRKATFSKISVRKEDSDTTRVVIGMATCGIAAGARPVMNTFVEEINTRNLNDVSVGMTGCMGMCVLEPMVDVYDKEGNKTTYVHMTPEKAKRVVAEHIVNGKPVVEFTIAGEQDNQA